VNSLPLAILQTGLVTPVGLDAPASCAAFRAKVTNPSATRFIDSGGEWIVAHQVPLEQPWKGPLRLAKMAALSIREALEGIDPRTWGQIPLLLCVAEPERPGRAERLDETLFAMIRDELGSSFSADSAIVAHGRVGVAVALAQARVLLARPDVDRVLIAATDSLLSGPALAHYDHRDRLLTERNSNGFMPGEAAGAVLVGPSAGTVGELLCCGIGFGREAATIDSAEPLRANGLTQAIGAALADAGREMHEMDFRITDISGEQYYFKEAALALSRTLHVRKETFDIWHPAECTGEVGSAAGATIIASVHAACRKNYALGPRILAHLSNDAGQRAALALQHRGVA
jgi:3-oxoacyl-[acyl-carrier-protein] synthase-1